MKIIADLKGFTLAHSIYVIDNDNIKKIVKSSMKNMPEIICELAKQNQPDEVILSGNTKYTQGIKQDIKNTYITKYSCECPFEIK